MKMVMILGAAISLKETSRRFLYSSDSSDSTFVEAKESTSGNIAAIS